jgi:pilus assembly protein CpaE
MVQHHSGVYVLAAPPETLPLDVLDSDKALAIVAASTQEFGTTLIDGPLDWTDWYMSILARSDEIIMLSDLSLAGLHNGRRRLDLLRQQGLDSIPLRLGLNMVQKSRFRSLSLKDAETALGRDVDFSIAQDTVNVAEALTRGETLHDLYPSSRAAKDLRAFAMTLIARDS